jgi:hypothetical protein
MLGQMVGDPFTNIIAPGHKSEEMPGANLTPKEMTIQ